MTRTDTEQSPRRRTRRLGALAAAAATGLLASCSFHPGVAAQVGSTAITPDELDSTSAVVCVLDQSTAGRQSAALRSSLEFLIGTQLVEDFGRSVKATPTGGELAQSPSLASVNQDARRVPQADRQTYVEVITRLVTAQQTLVNAGKKQLAGSQSDSQQTTADVYAQAGAKAYQKWLKTKAPDVSVDPRYGTWDVDHLAASDSSLSVAQSDTARSYTDGTASLPASQKCSSSAASQ